MKKFKKLLAMAIVVCMVGAANITTYAQKSSIDNEDKAMAESLLKSAINDTNTSLDGGTYSISDPIPAYALSNGEVDEFEDAQYHIVFCNGSPACIFTVNGANTSTPTYSLCEDFVDNLNDSILTNDSDYSFVITENQIFAVTDNEAIEIAKYNMEPYDVNEATNEADEYAVNNLNMATEYVPDEYESSEVLATVANIDGIQRTNSKTLTSLTTPDTNRFSINSVGEVSGTVPSYTQTTGSYYCWAISAWCVGETLTSKGKTVQQCVDAANGVWGEGGSYIMQKMILTDVYGLSSPTLYSALSEKNMKSLIDRDDPFIMICKNDNSIGHSVTCYKYDDSETPIKLKVMDSLSSSHWRWMTSPSSGTDYKITSAGTTYTYVYALTPSPL